MKLLIAGGGTGGHIFPALAIAEQFKKEEPQCKILFVGSHKGLEASVVPHKGFDITFIQQKPWVGKGLRSKIEVLLQFPKIYRQAKKILRDFKPDAVLGVGGYVSAPVLLAASRLKFSTYLLEQNVIPGVTNKMMSYFVDTVFASFEETRQYLPKRSCYVFGNPVRSDIVKVGLCKPQKSTHPDAFRIFVMGGSQGAHVLNLAVIEMLDLFQISPKHIEITHQTGALDYEMVCSEYKQREISARIEKFIDDVASCYENTDLVIARAGAGVVSELIVTKTPSILVPYPFAHGHQIHNAKILESCGAARMILQHDLSGEKIYKIILQLMTYEHSLEKMKQAFGDLNWSESSQKILECIRKNITS
ncbi:MAG: undecaprenyldiphospho-muramoylpentapeptide beta-N-acetylglucosaminyltransferase [Deltaproteobacteria bacterium]|nr:undecaprenyldiphospho-muramoylpentapeptide beta-N-acetylglucosaminyltransferase [Deltaproteobacteria bacterium]